MSFALLFTLRVALFTLLLHCANQSGSQCVAGCLRCTADGTCVRHSASLVAVCVSVGINQAKAEHTLAAFRPARSKVFRSGPPRRRGGPETSSDARVDFFVFASVFTGR